ncbi:MAG: hypothetical protein WDM90_07455 [Ferruginibacter sp.]
MPGAANSNDRQYWRPYNGRHCKLVGCKPTSRSQCCFFKSASLLTSGGTASVAGTYVFRLKATCGDGVVAQNDVTYTVSALPPVPTQTATTVYNCYTGTPINISGTAPVWVSGQAGLF